MICRAFSWIRNLSLLLDCMPGIDLTYNLGQHWDRPGILTMQETADRGWE